MTKPSYQTVPLQKYSPRFRRVAEGILALTGEDTPPRQLKREKGSYSVLASSTQETTAKIVIYEHGKGKTFGKWHFEAMVFICLSGRTEKLPRTFGVTFYLTSFPGSSNGV